ncbi:MAG: T9SS type A sorting domain-containing protein [Bacteroidetes bacterium]|nr:T9SS type A sorting domain-containing protein [Bacteroidota bacterium]
MKKAKIILISVFLIRFSMLTLAQEAALDFDGINDNATASNVMTNTNNFTLEAWVKPNSAGGYKWVVCFETSMITLGIADPTNTLTYVINGSSAQATGVFIPNDEWAHIALVRRSGTYELYKNGVAQTTVQKGSPSSNNGLLNISRSAGETWTGGVDEVRIWSIARTAQQILDNYNTGLAGTESGLEAYYKFNEGTPGGDNTGISQLTDASGNGKNATLNNFALTGSTSNYIMGPFQKYSGGDGTSGNPYQISCLDDLSELTQTEDDWNLYFIQTSDIDATQTQYWDDSDDNSDGDKYNDPNDATSSGDNEGFLPICHLNAQPYFYGQYDGDGYIISNLYIYRPDEWYNGLFGLCMSSHEIKDLGLVNVDITGQGETGALAGRLKTHTTNCYTTGSVTGDNSASKVGGFAGQFENNTIEFCYSTVNVSASGCTQIGGFVGCINGYYYGNYPVLENCYARGSVAGGSSVGGFSGDNWQSEGTLTVTNCYSTGAVSGSTTGGFIGNSSGSSTITSCYWNTETSGQASSSGGTGKTTAEMKNQSTYVGWDFSTPVWVLNSSVNDAYPFLNWQDYPPTVTTVSITTITSNSATCTGNISSLGSPSPTQHGVCWNTTGSPTISDSKTEEGAASATGTFTSSITGLSGSTVYHARAYATNSTGTSYGNQISFSTGSGETFVEIGTGTSTSSYYPIYAEGCYSWSRCLYLAEDIGLSDGAYVYKIAYSVSSGTHTKTNQNIYFKHTDDDSFASADYEDPSGAGYTQTYTGSASYSPGWSEIELDDAWIYNGTQNMLVNYEHRQGTYNPSGTVSFNYTDTENTRTVHNYVYNGPFPGGTGYSRTKIPNIRIFFSLLEAMTYNSSTTETASTDIVYPGSENMAIIRLNVVTDGTYPSINATSITFNTTGCTSASDLSNARVFYTESTTYSTATQFGSTVSNPDGSFSVTGTQALVPGNNYFWLAYDIASGATAGNVVDAQCTSVTVDGSAYAPTVTAPSGSRTITANPLELTATAGTTSGAYSTLKAAFDKIHDGTHQGVITISIVDNLVETETAELRYSGYSSSSYTSVSIQPSGGAARSISCDLDDELIYLYGADNVTIDGLNTEGNSLTIENANTGTSATCLYLYSSADNNTITNCTLKGSTTNTSSGIIRIRTGGNNNEISGCIIGPSGSNLPVNHIMVDGESVTNPSSVTINNNEFYDHFNASSFTRSIYCREADEVTITNNHFYQTAARTFSSSNSYCEIYIISGYDGHTITGNYLGGSSSSCGGSAMDITNPSSMMMITCYGMNDSETINISNNTVANIDMESTSAASFAGIMFASGIFQIDDNLIGSMSTSSISVTSTNTSYLPLYGIGMSIASGGTISSCSSNEMGGISLTSPLPSFRGIFVGQTSSSDAVSINNMQNNTIGGTNANSITIYDNASSNARISYGIYIYPATSTIGGSKNIQYNTIQNIGLTGDDDLAFTGMYLKGMISDQNIIRGITSATYGDITGIETTGNITGNTIYDLYNTNTTHNDNMYIYGIKNRNGSQQISHNKIYALKADQTVYNSVLRGVYIEISSDADVFNNEITLGLQSDGSNFGTDQFFTGIYIYNGSNVYNNTVCIGGERTNGFSYNYCIYRYAENSSYPLDLRNNILVNERTTSNPEFRNCVYFSNAGTSYLTINYNDYWAPTGNIGYDGSSSYSTLSGWQGATGQDAASINADPLFTNESTLSFTLQTTSPAIGAATSIEGITDDIAGITRPSPAGTNPDIGAHESLYGKVSWTGSTSNAWSEAGNWSPAVAPSGEYFNTIIQDAGNDPIITQLPASPAICYHMDIESDASLTIASGAALTVNGNLSVADSKGAASLTLQSDADGTGSVIVEGTSTGNMAAERYADTYDPEGKWHYVSSPVAGQSLNTTWMTANNIDFTDPAWQFFRWDEDTDYWIYFDYSGTAPEDFGDDTFVEARGYCLSNTASDDLDFSGTIRTNDVTYAASCTAGKGNGFNLTGNPFPSCIAITSDAGANNFLNDNAAILDDNYEAVYIWDEQSSYNGSRNDYKVICNTGFSGEGSSSTINQDYVQPGQAFMVKVFEAGNILFDKDIRAHADVDFFKNQESWPGVELIVKGVELYNTTVIAFHENMSTGLDPSFDAAKMKGNPDISLYTRLMDDNGTDFAVQALPFSSVQDLEVTVGLDISIGGNYEFSASYAMMENMEIILEDRELNLFTDLKSNSYIAPVSHSGIGRFFLHFKNTTGVAEPVILKGVQAYSTGEVLYIQNPAGYTGIVKIIDISGRELHKFNLNGDASQTQGVKGLSGMYIVNITTNGGSYNNKVLIK